MRYLISVLALAPPSICLGFTVQQNFGHPSTTALYSTSKPQEEDDNEVNFLSRRAFSWGGAATAAMGLVAMTTNVERVVAAEFTPGGTLVDREVGITVGNADASLSRKVDNSNVIFYQDYYFKFGTAGPWLEPDSTEFPKTMPFTRIQQRYDALKKYQPRILSGLDRIKSLKTMDPSEVVDPTASDVYSLRPMGLLANAMLASENSGATNELFLARWYINEVYLLVNDVRNAATPEQAAERATAAQKAVNSYLTMMNRVITPKVGDKFEYL